MITAARALAAALAAAVLASGCAALAGDADKLGGEGAQTLLPASPAEPPPTATGDEWTQIAAVPTAEAGPRLGNAGHVAALGEPDPDRFAADNYWADGRHFYLLAYLCAPPGRYEIGTWTEGVPSTDTPARRRGEHLMQHLLDAFDPDTFFGSINRFFYRESSGLVTQFSGFPHRVEPPEQPWPESWEASIAAPGMDWAGATTGTMYAARSAGRMSSCEQAVADEIAAFDGTGDPPAALLLVDVPVGDDIGGYATYGGMAVVSLRAAGGIGTPAFARLVAHELGHSILQLQHTDEAPGAGCGDDLRALMRSGRKCPSGPPAPTGCSATRSPAPSGASSTGDAPTTPSQRNGSTTGRAASTTTTATALPSWKPSASTSLPGWKPSAST